VIARFHVLVLLVSLGCAGGGGSPDVIGDSSSGEDLDLVLNEVVASPLFASVDWVEIHNLSDADGSLEGWSIRDDSDGHVHLLGADDVIAAHGFLVISDFSSPGGDGFGLGDADSVRLFDPSGSGIDTLQWSDGECPLGRAWGRAPGGGEAVGMLAIPTPGAENSDFAISLIGGPIRINEVVATPVGDASDWIELFNSSDESVSVEGWVISDKPTQPRSAWATLPAITLEAGEHRVLTRPDDFGFGLGGADEVHLVTDADMVADSLRWSQGQAPVAASFGRVPDGEGVGDTLAPPSPGQSNVQELGFAPGDVIVTEFLSNPVATSDADGEWIELFNTTEQEIDLGGWILADGDKGLHVIGGGDALVIAGGDHLVLCRSGDVSSNGDVVPADVHGDALPLANAGDSLELRVAGALIDSVVFEASSWGVQPGQAHALDPEAHAAELNDDPANWCPADTPWSGGDSGSPGEMNPSCASGDPIATP